MVCLGLGVQFMTDAALKKTYIDTVQALYPLISEEGADRKLSEVKGYFPGVYPRLGLVSPETKEIVCNARNTDELEHVLDSLLMGTDVISENMNQKPVINGFFRSDRRIQVSGLQADSPATIVILSIKGCVVSCFRDIHTNTVHTVNTPHLAKGVYILSVVQNNSRMVIPLKK